MSTVSAMIQRRLRARGALPLLACVVGCAHAPQARLEAGIVEGKPSRNADLEVYRGIPYAAPPVGDLRWRPPRPVARWTEPRQATAFAPTCEQAGDPWPPGALPEQMSED